VEPCQPLDFVDCGDKVNDAGALAPQSNALFAKELRDLPDSLGWLALDMAKGLFVYWLGML
jgi:hypothetical protein